MKLDKILQQIYFKTTGYSFYHLGRLFLRMFVGLMLAQFGVRQLMSGGEEVSIYSIPYITEGLHMGLLIVVELICSFFIMIGLFTRLMILPPFALMIVACASICERFEMGSIACIELLCIPFMFMGIYLFLLLAGAGKISVDYFYSLFLINRNKGKEEDLEEV